MAHVGAVLPSLPFPSDNVGPRLYTSDVVRSAIQYEDGHLLVPMEPGLGPVVELDRLEQLRSDGAFGFGLDLAGVVDRTLPS